GVGHNGYKNQTLPSVKCKDFFRKKVFDDLEPSKSGPSLFDNKNIRLARNLQQREARWRGFPFISLDHAVLAGRIPRHTRIFGFFDPQRRLAKTGSPPTFATPFLGTKMSALFLKRFLQRPMQVASIVPSSRTLVGKVAGKMDLGQPRVIAEFGPGEGCHTRE